MEVDALGKNDSAIVFDPFESFFSMLCDIYGSGSHYKSLFHLHLQADAQFNAVIDDSSCALYMKSAIKSECTDCYECSLTEVYLKDSSQKEKMVHFI